MLKAVVEDDRVKREPRARERRRLVPPLAGDDGAREAACQHHRLVAAVLGADERATVDPDHDGSRAALAVAARDDADPVAARREALGEPEGRGRLPGAADGEVADAQDARRHPSRREPAVVVKPVPQAHRCPVRG